ncbi:MAG: metal ABC transporter substrate-binding protein [Rhodoferax sp.]|nr:metal ABC transporter substrate-binding protein [Rhodoferax sp.]
MPFTFPHLELRRILLGLLAGLALLAGPVQAADRLPVVASFSILGDLVSVVGGDRVSVSVLVGPDEDAHVFEPRPADAKQILHSRMLVINGLGFEPWAVRLAKSAGFKGTTVVASAGVRPRVMAEEDGNTKKGHDHGHTDPHAWQNPVNVMQYVRNIAAALSRIDPAGAKTYAANRDAYLQELTALDHWTEAQFAPVPDSQRKLITTHDALGYFAARYRVNVLAAQGVSTESAASARQMSELVRQIKREKMHTVFLENMTETRLITQIGKDAGATVGGTLYTDALSRPGQPGASYLQMMRHNVTLMVQGMRVH